ncbi:putative bifunctional diguanylate cyclase/phosphodiesterase [Marinovum sp.]|uniref:putative bifunctional diguanylate cyclase/phosphodiesterase n=1 Tax=Marinovum sp. TaxID=2024839 RepID=UPI003A8E85F1
MSTLTIIIGLLAGTAALTGLGVALRQWQRRAEEIAGLRQRQVDLVAENARLMRMVEYDDLTSARSRRYLRELFARTRQDGSNAMIFVDLDEFKSVNDGFGHRAGDGFLRRIAQALRNECREQETLFRHGGDEFCIYLQGVPLDAAAERARTFVQVVRDTSVDVSGVTVRRTASAGVARIDPKQDMMGALYYADEALYAAKQAGGNCVRVTEGETLRSMIARRTGPRAEDLAEALRREEITYYVQPIYDTRAGRAVGVEALIRWVRSDGDVVLPAKFIDMMTRSQHRNLSPPDSALVEVAQSFCPVNDQLYCAFNISAQMLERPVEDNMAFASALTRGLNPSQVVLELVESAAIRNPARAREVLQQFRAHGIRIALDDFGTGFSNLERLQDFEVDIVKIDRRFLRGLGMGQGDRGILRALHALSRDMGFALIAEGVETEQELQVLQEIGIHTAQGYLLGRPETVDYWQARINQPLAPGLCLRKTA